MQEEDDEWGAFGGGRGSEYHRGAHGSSPGRPPQRTVTASKGRASPPSMAIGRCKTTPTSPTSRLPPRPRRRWMTDDEFGDFAEQPPEPTAVTQPGPGPVDGGDEDEFGDFASFDEAPAPPSPPPPTPPVSVAVGSARDLAALRGDGFTAGCSEALRVAFPPRPGARGGPRRVRGHERRRGDVAERRGDSGGGGARRHGSGVRDAHGGVCRG